MRQHPNGTRTTASAVLFARPFRLGRDVRELPAGSYTIHTHEEMFEGAFDPVFVATSIELIVETCGGRASRIIAKSDLDAALARDAARAKLVDEPSETPDRGRSVRSSTPPTDAPDRSV
ncbi:hypothetical protein [Sphingomonas lenta]|uniref:Uncharacterized protein n=1 Tax=Sphingomonas lenta TaxID=1141887 RepID=A0A2A2SB52_9SPHN|nr:hypothetical protein [Sphingomonas lenta]PAX06435.1 hypothetical protein CKY28_16875 [Sphingomonas lenta]